MELAQQKGNDMAGIIKKKWKWIQLKFGLGSSSRWIRVRDIEAEETEE